VKARGMLFIIVFVFFPVEAVSSSILEDELINSLQKEGLSSKEILNSSSDDEYPFFSLNISEEVRYERSHGLSLKKYEIPAFGEYYEGEIHASDVIIDCVVNGDAEDDQLDRWTELEYHGEGDSTEPEILDSDNSWGYEPEDGEYFYFLNVDSSQIQWVIDYYADTSIPEDDTDFAFSFSNAWESNFVNQSNVDLHITYDFDGFDVTIFLYAKSPVPYAFNTTIGGEYQLHFLINSSWGSGWHNIGPIDLSAALLQQNMYTKSSLPSYFTLNEIKIEALAYESHKLHLLVDNLSLKTTVDPDDAKLTVNGNEFDEDVFYVEGDVHKEIDDGEIGFKIDSARYDDVKYGLDGELDFSIGFREDLDSTVDYYLVDYLNVGWIVTFDVQNPESDKLQLHKIRIYAPPEWDAFSLIDTNSKEQISHTIIAIRENELYIRLKEPHVRSGRYSLRVLGPNYIRDLKSVDSTNHTYGLPLNLTLLRPLEQNMTIQLEKLSTSDVIFIKIIPVDSDFISIIIGLNSTFQQGDYRLITKIRSQFRAGIWEHFFTLSTNWAELKILSGNTVKAFDEYNLAVQCFDPLNESIIETATVTYYWGTENGTIHYTPSNQTYLVNFRADKTPGIYNLVLNAFAEGYDFAPKNMPLQVLNNDFILHITLPDNMANINSSDVIILFSKANGQPVEGITICIYVNGSVITEDITSENGTVIHSLPEFLSSQHTSAINISVIAFWDEIILASTSKIVPIQKIPFISEEITFVTTSEDLSNPNESRSGGTNDEPNEPKEYSLLIYGMGGAFFMVLGTSLFFRRRNNSTHGSTRSEPTGNKFNNTEEMNHSQTERPLEDLMTNIEPLSGISWQLRGIQSINDFAKTLQLSSEEVIQLINARNDRVPKEQRWRIIAGGQLIIPPDPQYKQRT